MTLKLAAAPMHPPFFLGNYCLFSCVLGYMLLSVALVLCEAGEECILRIPSTGAASRKGSTPRLRHGSRRLGRHLAAPPAPRPHRRAPQRPGAQIQAATKHR